MTTLAASPSTFVWVAKNGNDAKARRGRIDLPFLTIQAALTAALAGDAILVAPGTYAENLVIPDKDGLAIVGQNTTSTIITAALGPTLSWVPAAGPGALVQSFRTENLTFNNSDPAAGVDTLHVDGSAVVSPNTFLLEWFIVDCMVTKTGGGTGLAANLICVGRVIASLSNFTGTAVRCKNVGRLGATECSFASIDLNWDRNAAAPFPGTGREGYYLANSTFVGGNVVISGQPIFVLDKTSVLAGIPIPASTITATALTSFNGGGAANQAPVISLLGTLGAGLGVVPVGGGALTITLPADAGPDSGGLAPTVPSGVDLGQGTFWGAVAISKGAGANRNTVNARGAFFFNTISSGNLIDLDLRGATFTQAALAVAGTGTIDRDTHTITGRAAAAVSTAVPAFVPFPAGVTYLVTTERLNAAAGVTVSIVSKAANLFNFIASAAGATLGFTLTRVR